MKGHYLPKKMIHPWTTADQPNIFPACPMHHNCPTIQFYLKRSSLNSVSLFNARGKKPNWTRNTDKSASISYKQMLFLWKWRPGFNSGCWSIFMILWSGAAFVAVLVWELFPWQLHSFNIIRVLRTCCGSSASSTVGFWGFHKLFLGVVWNTIFMFNLMFPTKYSH